LVFGSVFGPNLKITKTRVLVVDLFWELKAKQPPQHVSLKSACVWAWGWPENKVERILSGAVSPRRNLNSVFFGEPEVEQHVWENLVPTVLPNKTNPLNQYLRKFKLNEISSWRS